MKGSAVGQSWLAEFLKLTGMVAVAEIGDKTMLITIALTARFSYRKVLAGIIPACIAVPAIGIVIALMLKTWLPDFWLQIISAVFFLGLFGWSLKEAREGDELEHKKRWWDRFGPVGISFCAFFVAEMADRTQFVTITMTTSGGNIWADWLGSATGLILANGIALCLISAFKKRLPRQKLMYGAAVLFLLSSVWMLLSAFELSPV